jgi:chromosome segregation ATPase
MKKSLKISLILIVTLVMASMGFSITYADVTSNHWAYDSIVRLSELEILAGIPRDGELYFEGNDPLSRYQAAVLIDKVLTYVGDNYARKGEVEPVDVEPTEVKIPESLTNKIEEFDVALKDTQGNYVQMTTILERFNSLEKQIAELREGMEPADVAPVGISSELRKLIISTSEDISIVSKKVDELETKTNELSQKDEDIMESHSQLSQDVVDLSMNIETAKTNINALSEDLSEILPKVSSNEDSIASLSSTLESYKANMEETNKELDTLKNEFASFKDTADTNYSNIENRVASIEEEFDDLINSTEMTDKLSELTESMVTEEELAATLEEMISVTDLNGILKLYAKIETVDELKTTVNNLDVALSNRIQNVEDSVDKDLGDLSRRIAAVENSLTEIGALEENVSSLESLYSELRTEISSNKDTIDSLNVRITSLETFEENVNKELNNMKNVVVDVANLQERTDKIEASVDANDSAIAAMSSRIDTMDTVLTDVASGTNANAESIETLTATVSQNNENLEKEIENIKKDTPTNEDVQSARNAASTAAWIGGAGIILGIIGIVTSFFAF